MSYSLDFSKIFPSPIVYYGRREEWDEYRNRSGRGKRRRKSNGMRGWRRRRKGKWWKVKEKEEEDEEEKEDKVKQGKQEEHKSMKRKRRHHTSCLIAGPWADHEESKWNPMECVKRVMLNCTALPYTLHCIAVHKTKYCS